MSSHMSEQPPSAQSTSRAPARVRSHGTAGECLIGHRQREPQSGRGDEVARTISVSPAADHSTTNKPHRHIPCSLKTKPSSTPQSYRGNHLPQPPVTRSVFDPWSTSSTGHQRAENRLSGSTSWRNSRNLKLEKQYQGGLGGGVRVADTVGAGSEDFGKDGQKANGRWGKGVKGLRAGGQTSLVEAWGLSKPGITAKKSLQEEKGKWCAEPIQQNEAQSELEDTATREEEDTTPDIDLEPLSDITEKQIFEGLCIYLNGSTAPLVSDHKLKRLLAAHGAKHSIALGRRTVTHVILSTNCGGGLAANKLEMEIARSGSKTIKFVTVEWVLESIKASRRLPESRFSPLKFAPKTQNTLFGMMQSIRPPTGE